MFLRKTEILSKNLELATAEEVESAESQLGVKFPTGYREYVTTVGNGVYSSQVRIFMPRKIVTEYQEVQKRWKEYYFWGRGRHVLPKEKVLESITIGDTLNGDDLIFHPSQSDVLYVLPGESERIYVAGSSLYEALEWLCRGIRRRDFISMDDLMALTHPHQEIDNPNGFGANAQQAEIELLTEVKVKPKNRKKGTGSANRKTNNHE
jgi:hypothetical protein